MIKIEIKGAEFDNFLMILRAKIEYCSRETDCRKCSFTGVIPISLFLLATGRYGCRYRGVMTKTLMEGP